MIAHSESRRGRLPFTGTAPALSSSACTGVRSDINDAPGLGVLDDHPVAQGSSDGEAPGRGVETLRVAETGHVQADQSDHFRLHGAAGLGPRLHRLAVLARVGHHLLPRRRAKAWDALQFLTCADFGLVAVEGDLAEAGGVEALHRLDEVLERANEGVRGAAHDCTSKRKPSPTTSSPPALVRPYSMPGPAADRTRP